MAHYTTKWFYRVDSEGRPIEGALFARKQKPTNGKWRRLFLPNCCTSFAVDLEGVTTAVEDLDTADLTQEQWKSMISLALAKLEGY